MLSSMTGYGKAAGSFNGLSFEVEAKSLNSRYLELTLRLPNQLQPMEYEIRELVKSKIKRGKLFVAISIKTEAGDAPEISFSRKKAGEAHAALKSFKEEMNFTDEIKLEHILSFKEVFFTDADVIDAEHFLPIKNTIEEALTSLSVMRSAEGKSLSDDLRKRILFIDTAVNEIQQSFKGAITEHYEKLCERMRELLKDTQISPERLDSELAFIADRADITEECVRIHSHVQLFITTIENEAEAGRRFNFLCQELNREVNTIASKSISTEIIHKTLTLKEEIERIREQVQNIE